MTLSKSSTWICLSFFGKSNDSIHAGPRTSPLSICLWHSMGGGSSVAGRGAGDMYVGFGTFFW